MSQSFVTALATKYDQRLRRYLSGRVRNTADVPDLAQEVFLRLMRVDNHDAIRSPEAYLFTVARHVVHQHTLRQAAIPASVDIRYRPQQGMQWRCGRFRPPRPSVDAAVPGGPQ